MAPVALFSALAQYVCERQETMAAVTCAGLTEVDAALADAANDAETPIAAASAASLRETFIVYCPFPRPSVAYSNTTGLQVWQGSINPWFQNGTNHSCPARDRPAPACEPRAERREPRDDQRVEPDPDADDAPAERE